MASCFFCDVQQLNDANVFAENRLFFSRYDDFPVTKRHCEIVLKQHQVSFFDLTVTQVQNMFELLQEVRAILNEEYHHQWYIKH